MGFATRTDIHDPSMLCQCDAENEYQFRKRNQIMRQHRTTQLNVFAFWLINNDQFDFVVGDLSNGAKCCTVNAYSAVDTAGFAFGWTRSKCQLPKALNGIRSKYKTNTKPLADKILEFCMRIICSVVCSLVLVKWRCCSIIKCYNEKYTISSSDKIPKHNITFGRAISNSDHIFTSEPEIQRTQIQNIIAHGRMRQRIFSNRTKQNK